jgi:small subunit ribosomal protein S8
VPNLLSVIRFSWADSWHKKGQLVKGIIRMSMTDPISDMLTRVRNASQALHDRVEVPASKVKVELARVLHEEGFIRSYRILEDNKQGIIRIYLKYSETEERVISGIKRISKPGRRVYVNKSSLPRVLGGLGVAVVSTSQGVMTDRTCRKSNVGGEVLCHVW